MQKHWKKMIAPIVIAAIAILYYIVFAVLLMLMAMPAVIKIIGAVISLILAVAFLYVTAERIHEIRSGEEDDLSKY